MTDKEIIKALECCCRNDCSGCPLDHLDFASECLSEIAIKSLDLINRQQAEIERLRENNKAIMQTIADVHTEAIKEYKEKLISEIVNTPTKNYDCGVFYLDGVANREHEIIEIIKGCEVKEMVGEDK